jgi:UDP-N-acetylglucosamine--N-acetylmuramyl-(pentapeptide) pyrophosphoryl-undecaprenol N-acetylglucosamine transferase
MTSVVIAAGGTGGHLVPALAIAESLARAEPAVEITFVGAGRALESELLAPYRTARTGVRPFTRDARGLLAPLSLLPATSRARSILRDARAGVVVGMGGYASVPVVAAARLAGIPSVIHEQNARPGLANELCARMTPNIAVTFAETAAAFRRRRPRVIGMPLRSSIVQLDREHSRDEAIAFFDLDPDAQTILAFGGSLGARRINDAVRGLVARWAHRTDVQVLWSAGAAHARVAAEAAASHPLRVRAYPYIERMDLAYAAADLALTRGGASTICELAVAGVPAIVVPYPAARRKEQHHNARALAGAGGAMVVDDASLTADRAVVIIGELLDDPTRLASMRGAARAIARPDAAETMAAWVLSLAKEAA